MAYQVTNKFNQKVFENDCTLRILVNGVEIDNDYVRQFDLDDGCFELDFFSLGSAIIQNIKLTLDNEVLPCPIEDIYSIEIFYGLDVDEAELEWIPIGVFDIGKEPDTSSSDCTTFQLYDYMNRFDEEIDFSSIVPCTRLEILQFICEKFDVELGSTSFLNCEKIVSVYDNTITARQYISFLAERAGGFAKIGRDGKLYIKSFSDVDTIELTENEEELVCLEDNDTLRTVSKVIYEDAIRKYQFGSDEGYIIWLSDENPFEISEEEVESIFESLNGFQFQSTNFKMLMNPSWDTGDVFKFLGITTLFQKKWSYNMGFSGECITTLKNNNQKSNVQRIKSENKIRKLKSTINELKGEIELLIQETDGNKEQITKILMDIQNILMSVQNSGGNNLILNSVGFAGTTEWQLVFDNEETSKIDTLASVSLLEHGISGGAFQLNGVKIKQEIIVNPRQKYSFHCKVSKKPTSDGYIKIYNKNNTNEKKQITFNNLEELNYKTFEQIGLNISGNTMVIEVYGDETSDLIVTDMVLTKGDLISPWTQAAGEILNTLVNINLNGVLVKSLQFEETGQYTVISPLEFAGYANKNGVSTRVFTLNGDTTEVEKFRSKLMIAMKPVKIIPITSGSNQGWALVPDSGGN